MVYLTLRATLKESRIITHKLRYMHLIYQYNRNNKVGTKDIMSNLDLF